MATKEEAAEAEQLLIRKLIAPEDYIFCIPDWDPVDSLLGLQWYRSRLWDFCVGVCRASDYK